MLRGTKADEKGRIIDRMCVSSFEEAKSSIAACSKVGLTFFPELQYSSNFCISREYVANIVDYWNMNELVELET